MKTHKRKVSAKVDTVKPDEPMNLGALSDLIGVRLFRARIAILRSLSEHSNDQDLHPGEFQTLALINANPGRSQVVIANNVHIDKSTMVALIDRLTDRGFVYRERSKTDRRRSELYLSKEGEAHLNKLKAIYKTSELPFAQMFSADELQQLMELLARFETHAE